MVVCRRHIQRTQHAVRTPTYLLIFYLNLKMAPLSGFAKRKLKLQKEEQTKKLAGSLARFVKPNSLVLSDTLPAVHTDAYIGK